MLCKKKRRVQVVSSAMAAKCARCDDDFPRSWKSLGEARTSNRCCNFAYLRDRAQKAAICEITRTHAHGYEVRVCVKHCLHMLNPPLRCWCVVAPWISACSLFRGKFLPFVLALLFEPRISSFSLDVTTIDHFLGVTYQVLAYFVQNVCCDFCMLR